MVTLSYKEGVARVKQIISYLRACRFRIAIGLAIKTVGTFMDLCIPWALALIIDDVIPKNDMAEVYMWGFFMLIFCLVAWFGNIIANRMAAKVARDTTEKIRFDLFSKITYLSCTNVDNFTVPSLISRMTSDTYAVHHAIGMALRMGVRAPILLVGGIIVTLFTDPVLTLVMLAVLPIVSAITFYVSKKGARLFKSVQEAVDIMVRSVRENAAGIRVIKALSKGEYEKTHFERVNTELMQKEKHASITMSYVNPIMSILLNLGLVMVIAVGAYRVNAGKTEIGAIIAFMTYFTIILNSIMMITRIFVNLSKAVASANRISEVLQCPDELSGGGDPRENPDAPAIEFKNVSFKYGDKGFSLNNISFRVLRGETIGILGPTGSGKTTLLSLLLKFYDAESGTIQINGVNINSFTLSILRKKFGTVLQNDNLFRDTVGENIIFGRNLKESDVLSAIRAAQAEDFITEAGGLDAEVNIKGANFSGGQKQRLLISRALAGNPEIYIFDDSFSALDYKTDSRVREELRTQFKDKTKVIVTQRVSSVLSAEHILVLDGGNCIGIGTHEELMRTCATYRETAELQLGGVLDE